MAQRDVTIPTPDGDCGATLHTPDGSGPWPAVIMYPDAGGVRPTFHDMAQRLADLGYAVLLPERLLPPRRRSQPFDMRTVFADADERARLMALGRHRHQGRRHARHRGDARLPRRAARGGRRHGRHDRVLHGRRAGAQRRPGGSPTASGAAASFHGGRIATTAPDSPHLLAGAMTATVYVAGAENDASFDDEQFDRLATALTEAGVDHTLVTYPALHGFAVPDNPSYDEAAAARHWEALEELYAGALALA